jgi:hypothetical protein
MVEIKNRLTGEVICAGKTVKEAVIANYLAFTKANLRGADLRGADLRGTYLRGADLRGAYLRGADFRGADFREVDLRGADLRGADLRGVDLRRADLRGADLREADLGGANLREAYLTGAKIAWQSHDLIAEILRRAAGDDTEKLKVAGLMLICREKCWKDFLEIRDSLVGWALDILQEWAQDGDDAPGCFLTRRRQWTRQNIHQR